MANDIKVDIISGFLGAGKTTFIKRLLASALKDEKVVLIENEFGEIGIDGGFLKESGIEIREMNSGCICCSLVGDFEKSLREIISNYTPDRIIIEPSGVGKLSDVMKAVIGVEEELRVSNNSAVTVVDAKKCKMYMKNFGEFFNNQIKYATTIVLSRTDIATKEVIDKAVEMIREVNSDANIVTTPIDRLNDDKLKEIVDIPIDLADEMMEEIKKEHEHHHDHDKDDHEEHEHCHHDHDKDNHEEHEHEHHHDHDECCSHHHHHHDHDADEIFTSFGLENVPAMSEDNLKRILDTMSSTNQYGDILRAKGMIPEDGSDKWLYFDLVPGEISIRKDEPDITGKVCMIGSDIKEDLLKEEFR